MRFVPASSLRLKLLSLVALSVVPSICVILYLGAERRNEAMGDAKKSAHSLLAGVISRQQITVESARQIMETLVRIPAVQNNNTEEVESILRALQREHPWYLNMFLIDPSGLMIASAVPHAHTINVGDRKYFRDAVRSGTFSAGEFAMARVLPQPVLHFAYPILTRERNVK